MSGDEGACALSLLPDALVSACLALLSPAERGAAACACSRLRRLARGCPAARHVRWSAQRGGATCVSDAVLRGALAAAAAAGGALTLDLRGARGFTATALLAVAESHGATLRTLLLASADDSCAVAPCTGCSPPGSALACAVGPPAGLAPAQLLLLAARLPACECLEADVFVDVDEDGVREAVATLAQTRRLRVCSVVCAASASFGEDAAGLPALLAAARRAGSLRELTLCSIRSAEAVLTPALAWALAAALKQPGGSGGGMARLAFLRCSLSSTAAAAAHEGAEALLHAAAPFASLAVNDCTPGDAWALAVGAALHAAAAKGASDAPRDLSLRALRVDGVTEATALGSGIAAAVPALRHVTLCCATLRREAAAALAAALPRESGALGLASLDVTPSAGGRSALALRLPSGLAAARAAGALARRRADWRSAGDAATAARVTELARRDAPDTLLLGSSNLSRRTSGALVVALAAPAMGAQLTSLHITRSRFSSEEHAAVLSAAASHCPALRALTLVTDARLRGVARPAADALRAGRAWPGLQALRLHALAYDEADDDAAAWAAVLDAPPKALQRLHLAADVPCAPLLALRGAWPGLRLLGHGAGDAGADALTGAS